jgi:signal peptidase I
LTLRAKVTVGASVVTLLTIGSGATSRSPAAGASSTRATPGLVTVCGAAGEGLGFPRPCGVPTRRRSSEKFVKRIVGLPGDRISIVNGHVIRNGVREHDPYIVACADSASCDFRKSVVIPNGDYFLMGDNRGESDDSRFWGPIRTSWILGKAIAH